MLIHSESIDTLHSDADGTYDISFFSSSVSHGIKLSLDVFGKFSGKQLSALAPKWRVATDAEKKAFLLESHEAAHHALLFSTPAGVLLWRINQVLSRDMHFISKMLGEFGLEVPESKSPRKWMQSKEFFDILRVTQSIDKGRALYLLHVIKSVEDLLKFRKILFEKDGAVCYKDVTFGVFIELANRVYPYLAERCEVPFDVKWTTRLSLETKIFPSDKSFNVMHIAECHAIAKELFLLRAFRDFTALRSRQLEAVNGPFGQCISLAIDMTTTENEIGFNPHAIQMSALIACSTKIDLSQSASAEFCLEEHLPWWAFAPSKTMSNHSGGAVRQAIESFSSQVKQPLIGAGSKWLVFHPISLFDEIEDHGLDGAVSPIQDFIQTLSSLGLDLQMYLIHQGAMQNLQFLLKVFNHKGFSQTTKARAYQKAYEKWEQFLLQNQVLIEYSDGILFRPVDLDQVYKEGHPARKLAGFERLDWPPLQLLGHILNGATARRSVAMYNRTQIPKSCVISEKIERYLIDLYADMPQGERGFIKGLVSLLEEVLVKGRDLPFGIKHLREITRDRFI